MLFKYCLFKPHLHPVFFSARDKLHQLFSSFFLFSAADPAQDATMQNVAIFQLPGGELRNRELATATIRTVAIFQLPGNELRNRELATATIRTVAIFQLPEVNFAIANLPAQQSETLRLEMRIKRNHFCSMRRRSLKSEVVLFDAQRCHATVVRI
jgi:hypothetical protein